MTMTDVFGDSPRGERVVVQRGDGLAERPETRQVINLASGVRWERLTPGSDRDVEFLYVVYPVGAASCPEDALMTHGGKEYGYVTSGTLGVQVGFEKYELGARRVDRLQLVVSAPAVGDRRRAGARGLGGHRPRGRSPLADHAAGAGRVAGRGPTPRLRRPGGGRRRPCSFGAGRAARGLVEQEREQDQHADRHLRVLRRLVEQRQDVVDQREEERCQQRPDERAPAAREARPAEDGRGDALERLVADDRRADLDLGREVEAGERRHQRADDEREDHGAVGPHPEPARRRLVETDGPQRQPRARAVEPPVGEEARTTTATKAIGTKLTLVVSRSITSLLMGPSGWSRSRSDAPSRMLSVPSVAMIDGRRSRRIRVALKSPVASPTADERECSREQQPSPTSRAASCTRRRRRTSSSAPRPRRRSHRRAARSSGRTRRGRAASSRGGGSRGCSSSGTRPGGRPHRRRRRRSASSSGASGSMPRNLPSLTPAPRGSRSPAPSHRPASRRSPRRCAARRARHRGSRRRSSRATSRRRGRRARRARADRST